MPGTDARRGGPFLVAVLAAAGCAAPGLCLSFAARHLPPGDRFVPALDRLHRLAPLIPGLALIATALWAWRRTGPRIRTMRRWPRVAYLGGLLVVALAAACLAAAACEFSRPNWLFGPPPPYARSLSPDGRRTAFATLDCFLICTLEVHVREGEAWVMHRVSTHPNVKAAARPRLRWSEDSQTVTVEGLEHEPPRPIFDWGPH